MFKSVAVILSVVASATAFAPVSGPRFGTITSTTLFAADWGKFNGEVWDQAAKNDVYGTWDPNSPRTALNFNPFETWDGNSPDASGRYPGEPFYKDPVRGDVNWEVMMMEKSQAEERAANPKPGFVPGCPGCRN
eukprot:CAMPEP_0118684246 /NCGR_PEP_ID=MMETSP0800-20121206/6538_1 /TAXON_ID=210618 ORGANISM="Striatella unipunctata, Strain CCMP2910" /NCGR_SAMPLE_ID=MMETSP0800 /ASSEMBLY_ACC=CAM_ASM_000638 /LENGTH=133 /DNA_ID=CAMNT_0006580933 /DNA_START=59 /DNA_END=460 /DNA_ORIENTATION=+